MYYVYILKSKNLDNWSYVGSTSNLEKRIKDHESGKTISTKGHRPLYLVYNERYNTREDAYGREKYLKTTSGRREKQKLLEQNKFNSEIV